MEEKKKKKSVFRYMGEGYAYLQAYMDDTFHFGFKKIGESTEDDNDKRAHKVVLRTIGRALGDIGNGYYDKYRDLKKEKGNLAEEVIYEDIPKIRIKAKNLKTKMELLGIKKGNLESLKRLKDPTPLRDRLNIKNKLLEKKMKDMKIKKGNLNDLKKLKEN